MEWLRQMSLKKAFLYLTVSFLLIALVLSVILITVTNRVLQQYRASIEIRVGDGTVYFPPATMRTALPLWFNILNVLQMALPVVFAITALISADIVFYRVKLKKPITELQAAAGQIINNNLDFSVQYCSKDEFGRLCESFEKMRLELMKNNRELWRQMDERKRLNAAFSHDLRNPITVMKGTVKLLKKSLASDSLSPQGIRDSLLLIEEYVNRIEKYIEAMSSVQRLEEIQCSPAEVKLGEAVRELADSVRMLAMDTGIQTEVKVDIPPGKLQSNIRIDREITFNVAGNLVVNALRFAVSRIQVGFAFEDNTLVLSVMDDGPGFSQKILRSGAAPFLRGDENNEQGLHFGMGLYVSRLLCEKHGGSLKLQNTLHGALATARFKFY